MAKRDTLLIVDDMEINRAILRGMFEDEYNILEAENGERALLFLRQYQQQITAVLLDLVMPIKDGYQVMEEMNRSDLISRIPVVVITSEERPESEVRSFDLGASDIIRKPFEIHVVRRRVNNVVELCRHKLQLEELVEEQSVRLRQANSVLIDAMSSVIESRSLESGQHIRRIRLFTKILLEDVARSYQEYDLHDREIAIIADAASMHDIGKIAIPDSILNKPGRLTPEEFEVMKTHTTKGCEILAGLERMQDKEYLGYAYNICRYHHERWDGRGYPDGLKGDNIPICAQVVAIADCYDALTTDRVYKKAIPPAQAFTMIINGECGAFSPRLLECFKNAQAAFAQLSREYADGRPAETSEDMMASPEREQFTTEINTLEQGQLKYFSLLRYLGSTVMEVDFNTGVYHVVYLSDDSFVSLRSGTQFEDSIRAFAQTAVHPEERDMVLELLGPYGREFFAEGRMKRTRRYRVLNRATGAYDWYEATMVRVDLNSPRQRKALIIWRRAEHTQADYAQMKFTQNQIYDCLLEGIYQCENDKWFTLRYFNQGLLNLVGYTEQELAERFHNRYIELVYEPDRDSMAAQVKEQLNSSKVYKGEYRLVRKDGALIWVLDHCLLAVDADGSECFYSILLDITKSKKYQEELRLSLDRHEIILNQSNDIIFEWDVATDSMMVSANWEKRFGYQPITENASRMLPVVSHIHPDDVMQISTLVQAACAGEGYIQAELRFAEANGRYRWCRVRATTQLDAKHHPVKVVGVITDIDNEKRATQKLMDRAERDTLTKLYNKEAGRKRVEWSIDHSEPTDSSAMLIIDVDDFKQINDRFGHMFGDAVLARMAERITGLFREGDVLSRIGGDEFLAFMPSIPSKEVAQVRAQKIIDSIRSLMREETKDVRLSYSIGIAYFPGDGEDFDTLFGHADQALYRAKAAGKNCWQVYSDSMPTWPDACEPLVARTRIDSEGYSGVNLDHLILGAFEKLYSAADFDDAVQSILATVGKAFNVSRVYIFETSGDELHCNNTYEWCNEGIRPEKEKLQNYPYVEGDSDYRDNFTEGGIFYCPDIKKLPEGQRDELKSQGILSMLQCAIIEDGKFRGFVGFDDCVLHRLWTQEQIDMLAFLSKLLYVFLMRRRALDRLREWEDK
ncbi:diguanylate cyclase [Oscillibacter hominis]|uniref:Stage 0 sporulation protein A homolog n=1 Tax=Oscillibacter hominis TaxID=2763056 RepID=A0A7G9B5L6_9FIRM|nr:diguanylate cyclase [Oscillibacter hominis]QNL44847.1 diguanylate cyclase [Oscillibacter hominis]